MIKDPPNDPTAIEQSQSLINPRESFEWDRQSTGSRPSLYLSSGRQSSFSKRPANREPRVPRTPNRVRFDIDELENGGLELNGRIRTKSEGSDVQHEYNSESWRQESPVPDPGQRAPLLTSIEAPSVTIAHELEFKSEDLLEDARPKSGLASAFLNMANSIIGAGIIGQPYAFRQAGLMTGIILLICLTITVDWTIRLIVVNSKLSGTNSFQSTMEFCFGKPGLIAISVTQWAFAFGGMIAFCIIVGDTIPQVLSALFPSLSKKPFLWLLTNRRAVIIMFILGISYPLSLYRDIAKVILMLETLSTFSHRIACKGFWLGFDFHEYHYHHYHHTGRTGSSKSERKIARVFVC